MTDQRISNLAKVLVAYSTKVRKNDLVAIVGRPTATPLIQEIYKEVLHSGGYPYLVPASIRPFVPGYEGLDQIFLSEASDDQLKHVDFFWKKVIEEFDVRIAIKSHFNTRSLSNVDPSRIRLRQQAFKDIQKTFMERSASGALRWVGTLFPTQAFAQEADMSLKELSDFVFRSTFCDREDPISEWNRIHDEQQVLVDWLSGKKQLKVIGPNVDLTLTIEGREFINSDGQRNMPSGEIFTGPVEDSVEGWVRFTYPAIYMGNEVEGIELRFEQGKVVEASAKKNEALLLSMLDTDEGSRYLGEFAIGTNKGIDRFIKDILYDEKIGGTIHLALGRGYLETGSQNMSSIHWDMICDMRDGGQIYVDEELFYESGEFKL
ncbi:MAG: aminopeptidase [Anaerolineales bacterium]